MTKHNIDKRRDSLEKFLIYMLGVAPDEFGLLPDEEGFLPLKELLLAINQEEGFRGIHESSVLEILNLPKEKATLELVDKRLRVKPELANFELTVPKVRPKLLYLGLKLTAWYNASQNGLRPKPNEDFIKLYPTMEMAKKVSSRFCPDPVIVVVNLSKAEETGAIIKAFSENLYFTKEIDSAALSGPPIPPRAEESKAQTDKKDAQGGHALHMALEPVVHHGKKKGKYQDAPEWKVKTRIDRRKDKE
jgi:putative RNA 2'-phosphotransferase